MLAQDNEATKAAQEELEKINADKELRYLYLRSEMTASDETIIRNYYTKLGRDEGVEALRAAVLEVLEELGEVPDSVINKISAEEDMVLLLE